MTEILTYNRNTYSILKTLFRDFCVSMFSIFYFFDISTKSQLAVLKIYSNILNVFWSLIDCRSKTAKNIQKYRFTLKMTKIDAEIQSAKAYSIFEQLSDFRHEIIDNFQSQYISKINTFILYIIDIQLFTFLKIRTHNSISKRDERDDFSVFSIINRGSNRTQNEIDCVVAKKTEFYRILKALILPLFWINKSNDNFLTQIETQFNKVAFSNSSITTYSFINWIDKNPILINKRNIHNQI